MENQPDISQANVDTLITVYGGSGFLGRHVIRALCKRGYRIRVAVRRPELAGHLQPLGRVGQIHAVQANLRYPGSVEAAARGADVVINLVGILFERGRQRFDAVQALGAESVALAASAYGARLVHVSAIGADENATSLLCPRQGHRREAGARGRPVGHRAAAVDRVRAGRRFLQPLRVAARGSRRRCRWSAAAIPASSRFSWAMSRPPWSRRSKAAPRRQHLRARRPRGEDASRSCCNSCSATIERQRLLVPLPFALAELQAWFLQFLPKPLLTPDQVELLKTDNVVSDAAKSERPHARRPRHRAGRDGGDRADLPLALPQDRPVQGQERRLT